MAAASHFNAGDYENAGRILDLPSFGNAADQSTLDDEPDGEAVTPYHTDRQAGHARQGVDKENVELLKGLCSLAMGDRQGSTERFREIAEDYPDSPNRNRALFLRWKAEESAKLPTKHPKLAAGLSAVVPGSGQIYTGRTYDGFRHFVFDGLLVYSVYRLLKDENYAGGYLLAGITLPFYLGNIVGAKQSAESYNASNRSAYVSQVIAEAGVE